MIGTADILDGMEKTPMTTQQLLGNVVRDEISRARLDIRRAAEQWHLAPSTVAKVTSGATVSSITLRAVEGGLGMPTRFLTYVAEGDQERIKRLPGRSDDPDAGLREDLRTYVLEALDDIKHPRRRRVGDR